MHSHLLNLLLQKFLENLKNLKYHLMLKLLEYLIYH
jgi:hypothetical protein